MGACLSCLGLGGQDQVEGEVCWNSTSILSLLTVSSLLWQNPETSRLLNDPYHSYYGSIRQQPQKKLDPEAERRDQERLNNICHVLSE